MDPEYYLSQSFSVQLRKAFFCSGAEISSEAVCSDFNS